VSSLRWCGAPRPVTGAPRERYLRTVNDRFRAALELLPA
jgi:hypothetical protein